MKKFNFKLEKILKIKEHNEIIAKEKYGEELQKKINLEMENKNFEQKILDSSYDLYKKFNKGDKIDFIYLNNEQNYIDGLKYKIQENNEKIKKYESNLITLKDEMIKAIKEKKKFEVLKEKEFKNYKKNYNKKIIKELDDISLQEFNWREK